MSSILDSVKPILGIPIDYDHFNPILIAHINSVFVVLRQLGIGPEEGFMITDSTEEWSDFIPEGDELFLGELQSYVGLKVRLMFDPPTNSSVTESINNMISEFEYRLLVTGDALRKSKSNI